MKGRRNLTEITTPCNMKAENNGTQCLLALDPGAWQRVRDGDPRWRALYNRHYSAYHYRDGRQPVKLIGPGEYLLLVTPEINAIFAWRLFRSMDRQVGLNCSIFRNESQRRSSGLIGEAMDQARSRWPNQRRAYTYVNASKIQSPHPGYCFVRAGWRHCGRSAGGLHILECDL